MLRRMPFAALALFLPLALAAPVRAQDGPDDEDFTGLVVTGEGIVRAKPDVAVLRIGAVAQADSAQRAQAQVDEAIQRTVDAIRDLDVPEERIQTQQVMLWPVYSNERPPRPMPMGEDDEPEDPRIVGFRASSTLEVRVEELEKTGEVLGTAVSVGANQLEGLSFELEDDTAQMQSALKEAVANARAKAEAMGEALGVTLGPIVAAHEGGGRIEPVRIAAGRVMAMEASAASVPVQPGEVGVRATVTLRYRLVERADEGAANPPE